MLSKERTVLKKLLSIQGFAEVFIPFGFFIKYKGIPHFSDMCWLKKNNNIMLTIFLLSHKLALVTQKKTKIIPIN